MKTDLNPFNNKNTSMAYSKADEVYQKSAETLLEFQDPKEFGDNSIIVDLGAGTGVSSMALIEAGAKNLTLVDPSRPMLEEAESKLDDKVEYLCASAENFYANYEGNVDAVYAFNSIHLFQNIAEALAGIACALKENGVFIFNISTPTYTFKTIDQEERDLIESNLRFYRILNDELNSPVLSHTIELLEKTLLGTSDLSYTKEKFLDLFKALNFEYKDSNEVSIEVKSCYQKNIWRMISQGFIEDEEKIESLIDSIVLPETIKLRQAQFKFQNKNTIPLSL